MPGHRRIGGAVDEELMREPKSKPELATTYRWNRYGCRNSVEKVMERWFRSVVILRRAD